MKRINLSIIVPCFNEEKEIKNVINKLLLVSNKYKLESEIIVVNDGSSDNTAYEIKSFKNNKNVKIITHTQNQGFGNAFKSGLDNANGEFITLIPGDNEANIEDTLLIYKDTKNVDMVVPFVFNKSVRNKGRILLSSLFTFIINITFFSTLSYTNGPVFYRTCLLKDLKFESNGFLFQSELVIKMIKKGYMYNEVPILLSKRSSGKTKAIKLSSLLGVIKDYFKLVRYIYFSHHKNNTVFKKSAAWRRSSK